MVGETPRRAEARPTANKTVCLKVIHFSGTPVKTTNSKGICDAGGLVIGGWIYAPIHP